VVLAVLALVLAVAWRGHWRVQLLTGVIAALVVVGVLALVGRSLTGVEDSFPASFYLWLGLVVFAAGVLVAGWARAPAWRRVDGISAVVLTALMAGVLINMHYDYYPTLTSIFGGGAANLVSGPGLDKLKATARRTGKLPANGVTVAVRFPATKSHFDARPGYVYLPPAWFAPSQPKLPVVLMLAGVPGTPEDWTRASFADRTADAYAAAHDGQAPILVFADNNGGLTTDTECVDTDKVKPETYVVQDVPAFVTRQFRTATGAKSWAVAGLSEGGTCAVMLALRSPSVFGTFVDFSGEVSPEVGDHATTVKDLFGGSEAAWAAHDPVTILKTGQFPGMGAWFESGQDDSAAIAAQQTLAPVAVAAGVATCTAVQPGGHDFDFFGAAWKDALPWTAWRVGAGPVPASTVATCQPPLRA
jgi:S-formylglutathione hydrolase FrmB